MRRVLDLAALITIFHRSHHAAETFDLAEFLQDRRFHCALHCLHTGRAGQHIHRVLKDARFIEQDRLPVRGESDPLFARRGEWFVRAVRVTRIRAVHVREHQFGRGAREIIFKLRRDQRTPTRLGVHLEHLRLRPRAECIAHSDCPDAA